LKIWMKFGKIKRNNYSIIHYFGQLLYVLKETISI
jgi:hypothetical protein